MLNKIHLFQGPTKAPTAPSGGWWGLTLIGPYYLTINFVILIFIFKRFIYFKVIIY